MTHPYKQDLPDKHLSVNSLQVQELGCFRQEQPLFHPVSFELSSGHGLWIKGPNGIGKSSLLRLIAGIATSKAGRLCWNNQSLEINKSDYISQLHYLGHADGLRSGLTVMENIKLAATIAQQPLQHLETTLSQLQLNKILHQQVQHLSAGQKRRAALARFFLIPRALWILDEPLTTLDIHTQEIVSAKISEHLQQGGLCLLTSHQTLSLQNMEYLELQAC